MNLICYYISICVSSCLSLAADAEWLVFGAVAAEVGVFEVLDEGESHRVHER